MAVVGEPSTWEHGDSSSLLSVIEAKGLQMLREVFPEDVVQPHLEVRGDSPRAGGPLTKHQESSMVAREPHQLRRHSHHETLGIVACRPPHRYPCEVKFPKQGTRTRTASAPMFQDGHCLGHHHHHHGRWSLCCGPGVTVSATKRRERHTERGRGMVMGCAAF